ncbi:hypothetical protein ED551_12060 [Muribaculaceae bacterium Isolate-013 (NCI)]|nr:hypothetical protein ED551_12060 [Muribaculaceae bacterium Isolate-013 (NCI)]
MVVVKPLQALRAVEGGADCIVAVYVHPSTQLCDIFQWWQPVGLGYASEEGLRWRARRGPAVAGV